MTKRWELTLLPLTGKGKARRLSMYRAGKKLFIYCGPTAPVVNMYTGEIRSVAIFVAVIGSFNYTYVETCEGGCGQFPGKTIKSGMEIHCICGSEAGPPTVLQRR